MYSDWISITKVVEVNFKISRIIIKRIVLTSGIVLINTPISILFTCLFSSSIEMIKKKSFCYWFGFFFTYQEDPFLVLLVNRPTLGQYLLKHYHRHRVILPGVLDENLIYPRQLIFVRNLKVLILVVHLKVHHQGNHPVNDYKLINC